MRQGYRTLLLTMATLPLICTSTRADDWPMWRCDAQRTAASNETLPSGMRLLWSRDYGPRQQAWDDPLNNDLMTYDRIFEPIVMGGRLFVGFNDQDKLTALDAQTGEELWTFFTEGSVRVPPAGHDGKVYFCSDDGFLYCVDASTGTLQWKLRGGPSAQHAIGNQRIVSAWVARGGPVVREETVYFAASIWHRRGFLSPRMKCCSCRVDVRCRRPLIDAPEHSVISGSTRVARARAGRFSLRTRSTFMSTLACEAREPLSSTTEPRPRSCRTSRCFLRGWFLRRLQKKTQRLFAPIAPVGRRCGNSTSTRPAT